MLRQLFLFLAALFSGLAVAYTPQVGDKAIYDFFIIDSGMESQAIFEWEIVEVKDEKMTVKHTYRFQDYEAEKTNEYPIDAFGTDEKILYVLNNCRALKGKIEYLDLVMGRVKVCTYPVGNSIDSVGFGVPGGIIKSHLWGYDLQNIRILREFISAGSKVFIH